MKHRIVAVMLASMVLVTSFAENPVKIADAKIVSQDSCAYQGDPAMALKDVSVLEKTIKKGTVVRLKDNSVEVNGEMCAVNSDDFLVGDDLNEYVAENPTKFSKKVTTKTKASLYDPETYKVIASVNDGTSFISTDEDSNFYTVTFDDREALLYKKFASEEIFVQVTSLTDLTESLNKLIQQNKELLEKLGIDDVHFEYVTEAGGTVVDYARQFVGNPYVWGGTSLTDGADCSGFVQQIYKRYGIELPRCSRDQSKVGEWISKDEVQPGDLLFFTRGSHIGHVAIYAGSGKIVHAKGSKYGIVYEDLKETPAVCRRVISE